MVVKAVGMQSPLSQERAASKDGVGMLQLSAAFVLGFVCVYVKTFASMTSLISLPDAVDKGLLFAGAAFLSLHIVSKSKSYGRRLVPLLLVLLSTAYTYLASGETAPLSVSLIVIAAATAGDSKSLVRLWLATTAFLSLFVMGVYGLAAVLDPGSLSYVFRWENGVESSVRFTFFFAHPNMVAAIVMMMCGAYMYLNYDKLGFRTYIIVLAIAVLVLLLTDSKTSTALIAFLVICFAAQKQWRIFAHGRLRRLVSVLPILLFVLVYLIAGPLYNDSLGQSLTGRVSLWHYCLVNQGLTLFGQHFVASQSIGANGWAYYYTTLDCAYASGLFVLGLCFSGFFCWCVCSRVKNNDSQLASELPLILAMLIFGITEVHIFSPVICVSLLLLAGGILPPKDVEASARKHGSKRNQSNV